MTLIVPQIGGFHKPASTVTEAVAGVTGTKIWLDATDISTLFTDAAMTSAVTTSGDRVGGWADKSGNGYHHTQTDTGKRPTYDTTTMTQESLSFSGVLGTRDFLYDATEKPTGTIFTVWQTSVTNPQVLFGFDNGSNRYAYFDLGGTVYVSSPSAVFNATGYVGAALNVPTLLTINMSTSLNANFTEYDWAGYATSLTPTGTYIGRRHNTPTAEGPLNGNIVELITYDRILSSADVETVENHLNTKHGLGLSR